jgi:hypothetical protein
VVDPDSWRRNGRSVVFVHGPPGDLAVDAVAAPGSLGLYNVGSEEALSILDVSRLCVPVCAPSTVATVKEAMSIGGIPDRYVPSKSQVSQARGLCQQIALTGGIERTRRWFAADVHELSISMPHSVKPR